MGSASCKSKNPTWEYRILVEQEKQKLLSEMKIELASLRKRVEFYDIWRYWEVNKSGGFYFDADVDCIEPLVEYETYFKGTLEIDMIIGVEIGPNVFNSVQFLQWQFASVPNNPILHEVLDEIKRRLQPGVVEQLNNNSGDPFQVWRRETLLRTGPAV